MIKRVIDGKAYAKIIKDEVRDATDYIKTERNENISLVIIQVGNNHASDTYVKNKIAACNEMGIKTVLNKYPENITEAGLVGEILKFNNDPTVHGIIVQLPLPDHINENNIACNIDFRKDIDGLNPINMGILDTGMLGLVPCTAIGIVETIAKILHSIDDSIEGKHCVVIGRSNIVGKPVTKHMTMENATVTLCHSKTKNLKEICKLADILIVAIGKPKFITKEYIKDNAIVFDVGINRDENNKLCGDVDFDDVKDVAWMITPVPGGVGPLTTAMVGKNTVRAYNMLNPDIDEVKPEISVRVNNKEEEKNC